MSLLFQTSIMLVLSSYSSITSFPVRKLSQIILIVRICDEKDLELLDTCFLLFQSTFPAQQIIVVLLESNWTLARKLLSDSSQYLQKDVLGFGTGLCWGEWPNGKREAWVWILTLCQPGFSCLQLGMVTLTLQRGYELAMSWHINTTCISIIINKDAKCGFRNLSCVEEFKSMQILTKTKMKWMRTGHFSKLPKGLHVFRSHKRKLQTTNGSHLLSACCVSDTVMSLSVHSLI